MTGGKVCEEYFGKPTLPLVIMYIKHRGEET